MVIILSRDTHQKLKKLESEYLRCDVASSPVTLSSVGVGVGGSLGLGELRVTNLYIVINGGCG
jgi:hypothetical protein